MARGTLNTGKTSIPSSLRGVSGWASGRVGEGGTGWSVTGSLVLSGGHHLPWVALSLPFGRHVCCAGQVWVSVVVGRVADVVVIGCAPECRVRLAHRCGRREL